jgi:hypothetical protein
VSVGQPRGAETALGEVEDFTQGVERGFVGGGHGVLDYLT